MAVALLAALAPAAAAEPYPEAPTKKGLQVQSADDAEELGIGHAAVNVAFDQLMYESPAGVADAIPFESGGRTYWFRGDYVTGLDRQVEPLSDDGVLVHLILILYDSRRPNSALEHLLHPDAARGQGTVYAFNPETPYFAAAMEFLVDRYSRSDQRHGRVVGYIVGNEIDSAWQWYNMGDQPLDRFVDQYERALRIAWQATRRATFHPRVYVSLDHFWTLTFDPARPTRYYPGREIVDRLAALTRARGDFPWHVAYHPYPENLFEPDFWNDTTATPGFDTPRITFKNLEVLPAYVAPRRIILSEQGFHTPPGAEGERLQAAAFAYAYYKTRFLDGIDAFILHRHVDHQDEGGLLLGVRRWDAGRFEPSAPGEPKPLYDVFRDIDTPRSLAATEFAKGIVGIRDWAEAIPGFDSGALAEREPPARMGVVRPAGLIGAAPVAGRWEPAENASAAVPDREPGMAGLGRGAAAVAAAAATVSFDAEALLWRGATLRPSRPLRAPWLALSLRVPVPSPGQFRPDFRTIAKIKAYGAGGRIAEGVAPLESYDAWIPLAVKLPGWAIDRVKVWVRGTTNDDWSGSFQVRGPSTARLAVPEPTPVIDVDAALDRAKLSLTVTNHDIRPPHGRLTVEPCDGLRVSPDVVHLTGATRTYTLAVTRHDPADPRWPRVCLRHRGATIARVATAADPTGERALPAAIRPLYNFEAAGTDGWRAGANVAAPTTVHAFPNAPGRPRLGASALDAESTVVPASAWRTVRAEPPTPLDLSGARTFFTFLDGYGGAPGASGYEARIALTAADGSTRARTVPVRADAWSRIALDVSDWPARGRVTAVEAGYRAVGSDAPWNPHLQVDFVGTER